MNPSSFSQEDIKVNLLLLLLGASTIIIGGGLYEIEAMPKDEYLVSILAIIMLGASYALSKKSDFVEPSLIIGYLIFNAYFCIRLLFSDYHEIEIKTYLLHFISLGLFVSFYTATKLLLAYNNPHRHYPNKDILIIFILLALACLLGGQIFQIFTAERIFGSRPGGFLNPNTTAALALMFLYATTLMVPQKRKLWLFAGFGLSTLIIFITQSRASLIILLPYLLYVLFTNRDKMITRVFIAALILILIIILATHPDLYQMILTAADRFKGDYNSDVRADIALTALSDFMKAPVWGHGYQYLMAIYDLGSHNQITEILVSYGVLGILIIGVSCYFLYLPCSILFLVFCVAPTLIFSHNFFEIYHFQAILGFSLAIDRYYRNPAYKEITDQ